MALKPTDEIEINDWCLTHAINTRWTIFGAGKTKDIIKDAQLYKNFLLKRSSASVREIKTD